MNHKHRFKCPVMTGVDVGRTKLGSQEYPAKFPGPAGAELEIPLLTFGNISRSI